MSALLKKLVYSIFHFLFSIAGKKTRTNLFNIIVNAFGESNDSFASYHLRPYYAKDYNKWNDPLIKALPKMAIVIQGPLLKEKKFTLETIKIYKKNYPDDIIILSTWEGEDPAYLIEIKKEGVELLLNKKPNTPGLSNRNLQIYSTLQGLKRAKELGYEYAIKTRTDQRFYAENTKEYLFNLLKTFPLSSAINTQKERLVCASLNTFKYRRYGISDMFTFGHMADLLLLWDIDLQDNSSPSHDEAIINQHFISPVESFITTSFLKKISINYNWELNDSWKIFAEHFIVINKEDIDFYWPKYNKEQEYRKLLYDNIYHLQELSFREWINLHSGIKDKDLNYPNNKIQIL